MATRRPASKTTKPSAARAKPASRSGGAARASAATPARRTRAATGAQVAGTLARTIPVNRPEVEHLVKYLELPEPSMLSPLIDLMAPGAKGSPRPIEEVTTDLAGIAKSAATFAFSPLAVPDRIVDLRGTIFNGAPMPCRLYASRHFDGIFAGIRPGYETDYELLAPFSADDVEVSARMQLQFSAGSDLPTTKDELTAEQLAFLLVLVDAYKMAFIRTFTVRRPEPAPVTFSMADILEAQTLALSQPDRRWIAHAIGELLGVLVHPGGRTDVRLPVVNEEMAKQEIRRYVSEGHMSATRKGNNPSLELGTTLSMFAGSLFTWLNIQSFHDMQVIGFDDGSPQAQEDLLILIATEPAIWAIASQGLTRAEHDLSAVTFVLRSLDLVTATQLVRDFVDPIPGLALPGQLYSAVPQERREAGVSSALPSEYEEASWTPTHVVPGGGMRAWEAPDPSSPPVTEVAAGLEVQVIEANGAWAHVVFSNGWSAWVDGRQLMERSS